MCGFIGMNFPPKVSLNSLIQMFSNRGPDSSSSLVHQNHHFGHARLEIINLDDSGSQPMKVEHLLIVFNGEIYNYKDLKEKENLQCTTRSDTEVLARMYLKYQEKALEKINGMFSFCIFDTQTQHYFCARDRYGKKPLYYLFEEGKFIVCSQMQPILKAMSIAPKLNKVALSQYFQYFVPLSPNTFFQGIYKLPPGSYLRFDGKEVQCKKYYKIKTYKKYAEEASVLKTIEELLEDSIAMRYASSDVEVGALLSGGIDSSLVLALTAKLTGRKIPTFSVGYTEHRHYSELPYAKIMAQEVNCDHHIVSIDQKMFIDGFEELLEQMEEPHGDSAAIPLSLLLDTVKKQDVKVLLSGEGSDELFLGYDNYRKFLKYYEFEKSLSSSQQEFLNSMISSLQNNTKESEYLRRVIKKETLYNSFGEVFTQKQKKQLFYNVPGYKSEKPKKDPVDWMSYIDMKIWLGEALLSKVDRVSQGKGLEVRTPFLDYRLVDYLFATHSWVKVGDTNKYLLKKIAQKYLPNTIITRQKKGFNSPYNEWIFEHYQNQTLEVILRVNTHLNLFQKSYILWIHEQASKGKFKQHFWLLYLFCRWYEKNF